MISAFFSTVSGWSVPFFWIDCARPAITLSGVPTSCAISAASWPIVASFSVWPSRCSSASFASFWRWVSPRDSRSENVISLKRVAIWPISSSRSARMTCERSPLATSSMPRRSFVIGRDTRRLASAPTMSVATATTRTISAIARPTSPPVSTSVGLLISSMP